MDTLTNLADIYNFAEENGTKLSLTVFDDCVWINHIIVKDKKCRGKGVGGTIIRMLQEWAKSQKKIIKLLASNCYGTPLSKLYGIYSHLGFKHYKELGSKCKDYMKWEY